MPLKSLKPSMREKKRYLLVRLSQVQSGSPGSQAKGIKEGIYNSIRDFLGTAGMAKVSLSFIKIDSNKAIISINREMLNQVRAGICIWPERMEVLRVSGTIKGLRDNAENFINKG